MCHLTCFCAHAAKYKFRRKTKEIKNKHMYTHYFYLIFKIGRMKFCISVEYKLHNEVGLNFISTLIGKGVDTAELAACVLTVSLPFWLKQRGHCFSVFVPAVYHSVVLSLCIITTNDTRTSTLLFSVCNEIKLIRTRIVIYFARC